MKILYERSAERFLVIGYTNHALDQFLEELEDVGIPKSDMVRLGSKSTPRTAPLLLKSQKMNYQRSQATWALINALRTERQILHTELKRAWDSYSGSQVSFATMMEFLEFSEEFERFHDAFAVPAENANWKEIGKKGKTVQPDYLYNRWVRGLNAGIFAQRVADGSVWIIAAAERQYLQSQWIKAMMAERVEAVHAIVQRLNDNQNSLAGHNSEHTVQILNSKRVIGCTTTAAAMYSKLIRAAKPDTVLVEEAGEILESHILTALSPTVKRLVLIGDHKQLRPKINNYELSVEKGLGYDLNRSLFERLILQGHPHTTLRKQHRMHPDISEFARALTYPDLLDGPTVADRAFVSGIRDRVIFLHHENRETELGQRADRRDPTSHTSKENNFEADMVLKIVTYLGQQGYQTDRMAVLTPYLGQLRLLRDKLAQESNPVLNDLDSHDLIRAGLMTQVAAKANRQPLRLSSIGKDFNSQLLC
jgi:hypothetical protein